MDRTKLKQLLKTGLKALVVCLVIAAALIVLSSVFHPKNNRYEDGMIDSPANGAIGETARSVDVLVVGDSEAFSSISPMALWHETGVTSYVCATGAQQLPYSHTLLRRATMYQSPRYVFFETNSLYAPFTVDDLLMRSLQDTFPIFEFHSRWKRLTPRDFIARPVPRWTDDLKGFRVNKTVVPAKPVGPPSEYNLPGRLPHINRAYFKEMIDYCWSIGATPVLFTAPNLANWNAARHNYIQNLANEMGLDFLDFNTPPYKVDIDWNTETRDGGDHLNYQGALKFTRAFGSLLTNTYGLIDHRGNEAYAHWDAAYARYLERTKE